MGFAIVVGGAAIVEDARLDDESPSEAGGTVDVAGSGSGADVGTTNSSEEVGSAGTKPAAGTGETEVDGFELGGAGFD